MSRVRAQVSCVARLDFPVLLLGETGTGKDIVARLIHQLSPRASHPFWKVNCAALPRELVESELFGHEEGAFTGAKGLKRGQFELCEQGSIFLDEVAELDPGMQAKLLQVLEDEQFCRVGGCSAVKTDARLLAATNLNVVDAFITGKIREDLYQRLSVFAIHLPPLRERREDIPPLLKEFMVRLAREYSLAPQPVSQALLDACLDYPWPGNVRELASVAKRYLVYGDEDEVINELAAAARALATSALRSRAVPGRAGTDETPVSRALLQGSPQGGFCLRRLKQKYQEQEKAAIAGALEQTGWKTTKAARLLSISYKTLQHKIELYQLHPSAAEPQRAI